MKTKLLLAIMLFGTAWILSCSKDDDNKLPGFPMVSTITVGESPAQYTVELVYDSENRLVSYEIDDTVLLSYAYGYGTVTRQMFGYPGQVILTDIYTLNTKGQAVSCTSFSDWNGSFKPSFPISGGFAGGSNITTYEYDENGYLVRMVMIFASNDTATTTYTILNGNVVSETTINGFITYTTTYNFYTDKSNTIGNENLGIYFLGKQNANLVQSINSSGALVTYSYEFDGAGRVTRQTIPAQSLMFTYRE